MIDPPTPSSGGGRRPQSRHAFWFCAILFIAALLRLPGLDRVPPPLSQDEASRGYDAWCLLETGADRHGESWPFFLESFGKGDYTASLSTLLTIPFVAVLGPTTTAMRLPDAICGVLTVVLLYAWLRRRFDERVALIGAAALALDPWHISLCRTAHESGFAPFFLCAAMLCLERTGLLGNAPARRHDGARGWAFFAGFAFAMHAWLYPATRLFTPLFLFALWLTQRWEYRDAPAASALSPGSDGLAQPGAGQACSTASSTARPCHPPGMLYFVAGLMIGAIPLWWTALTHPEQLTARAGATLLDWSPAALPGSAWQFLSNYAANLSPSYLFIQCDEMSGASIPGVGQHLWVAAPLMLTGLVIVVSRARTDRFARLLVVWLLLYPLPAAICGDWNPHIMRTAAGLLLFPVFAGIGGSWFLNATARFGPRVARSIAIAFGLAVALNAACFVDRYFIRFPPAAEAAYQSPLFRAIRFAAARADSVDFILVTNRANQPYIYALLAQPIAPGALRESPPIQTIGILGFHHVARVGKWFFAPADVSRARDAFENEWQSLPRSAEGLVIERAGRWPAGHVLATFQPGDDPDPMGSFEVRRWRLPEDVNDGETIAPR